MNAPDSHEAPCAVVVSHKPDDGSIECIESVLAAFTHTVVVENSSDEPARSRLKGTRATFVDNAENRGIGAALNQGIASARSLGFGSVALFDQDTLLLPDALPRLLRTCAECRSEIDGRLALFGTNFFHALADGSIADAGVPFSPGREWIERDFVITSGTLLSLEAHDRIGPFDEGFFLDHVDHEYCLRARRRGFVNARSVWPLMVHRIGMARRRNFKPEEGTWKLVNHFPAIRRYYQMRNLLALEREYGREFPGPISALKLIARREVEGALRHEPGKLRKALAVFLAWNHARRGITGPYRGRITLPDR